MRSIHGPAPERDFVMCCSSTAAKSPMAQFLKSQSPDELWKASLKPKDPLKPDDAGKASPFDPSASQPSQAAKAPGIGVALDVTA
jgi:hypothetical protein